MFKKIHPAILVLILGIVIAVVIATIKPKPQISPPLEKSPPLVKVINAQPRAQVVAVETQGSAQPQHQISLVTQVSGQITEVSENYIAGGFVSAGEVLAQIDSRDYQIAIVQAKAALANAQQRLAEEQGRADQARRQWRDTGNREANALFLRKPQLAAARAEVEAAEGRLQQAEINLERTAITAPFDGRIVNVNADRGQFVNIGTAVASLFSTGKMEVRLPLSSKQLAILSLNTAGPMQTRAVQLSPLNQPDQPQWQGQLVRTEAQVDSRSRLYYAFAEVAAPYQVGKPSLQPGMFVLATIESSPIADTVTLPRTALIGNQAVYRVTGQRLVRQPVNILQQDDRQMIVSGIAANTLIALSPPGYLKEGDSVQTEALAPAVEPSQQNTKTAPSATQALHDGPWLDLSGVIPRKDRKAADTDRE